MQHAIRFKWHTYAQSYWAREASLFGAFCLCWAFGTYGCIVGDGNSPPHVLGATTAVGLAIIIGVTLARKNKNVKSVPAGVKTEIGAQSSPA